MQQATTEHHSGGALNVYLSLCKNLSSKLKCLDFKKDRNLLGLGVEEVLKRKRKLLCPAKEDASDVQEGSSRRSCRSTNSADYNKVETK